MYRLLTPGSAMPIQHIGNIIKLSSLYTIKELKNILNIKDTEQLFPAVLKLKNKQIKKLVDDKESNRSSIYFDSNLFYRNQNMSGSKLIPMFANSLTSHAKLQNSHIIVNKVKSITLNNKNLTELDIINIKNDKTIKYISNNLAAFLNGAVDNTKNPILGSINANEITTNYLTYLLRLSYDIPEVCLFIAQPIIKEFVLKASLPSNK
jgi:hypothetical protein